MLASSRARGAALAFLVLTACHEAAPGPEEIAATPAAASTEELGFDALVALLATAPEGSTSELYWVDASATELPAPSAFVEHARGAMVRAALLPGPERRVAVVADASSPRDRSFAAALFVAEPGGGVARLADHVVHASRPLPASDGSIVVSRGKVGHEGPAGRVDTLTLDAIEPATGRARQLASFSGFTCFIAGELDGEIIAYVVDEAGASLVGVSLRSGAVRPIAAVEPLARDFTVDVPRRALVFTNRAPDHARTWQVVRLELDGGAAEVLHEGPSLLTVPSVLAGGAVAIHDRGKTRVLGGGEVQAPAPGVLRILGRAEGGEALAGLATEPGAPGTPVVLSADGTRGRALPSPSGARVTVAGLVVGGVR